MTKKDYILIAGVIKNTFQNYLPIGIDKTSAFLLKIKLVENFSLELEKDNPQFCQDIFIKTCSNENLLIL